MRGKLNEASSATPGEDCREKLSSLVDGELSDGECAGILDRACADPQVRELWVMMHAVGDAMRSSEVGSLHSNRFADRVSAALAREPTIVAPGASRRRLQRVLIPGAAVAAAAALLAVVAIPQLRGDSEAPQIAATPTVSPASEPQPVEMARVPELERYLRAHRELASGLVMPQATPYLRTSNNLPLEAR